MERLTFGRHTASSESATMAESLTDRLGETGAVASVSIISIGSVESWPWCCASAGIAETSGKAVSTFPKHRRSARARFMRAVSQRPGANVKWPADEARYGRVAPMRSQLLLDFDYRIRATLPDVFCRRRPRTQISS